MPSHREASEDEQPQADVVIRKARPIETAQPEATMPSQTDLWASWIESEIRASETALLGGVADVMAEERKRAQTAIGELRRENETLVEKLLAQVTALAERIAKLESERMPSLRAVG